MAAVQTVFAPTNAAFGKLAAALGTTPSGLLNRTALLTTVLTYHGEQGVGTYFCLQVKLY